MTEKGSCGLKVTLKIISLSEESGKVETDFLLLM
jgi:hypothetical protein